MGRRAAEKPLLLSEKLIKIRLRLGFTQEKMYESIRETGVNIHPGYISLFETGQRIPSLLILLAYSRIGGIAMEIIVDDKLELTENYFKETSQKQQKISKR